MTLSGETDSWVVGLVDSYVRSADQARRILDGRACLVCGGSQAGMIPVGEFAYGQVFAHVECDRAMKARTNAKR